MSGRCGSGVVVAAVLAWMTAAGSPAVAEAACEVKVVWAPTTGGSSSYTVDIATGSTENVNQEGMLRVRNEGSQPVRIYLSIAGAQEINRQLAPGEPDPPGGVNYAPYHELTKIDCLSGGGGGSPLTPGGLVAALVAQGVPVAQIVAQVKASFNLSGSAMVELAAQTNLDPIQTAHGVRSAYGAGQAQLAGWLFDAGHDAVVVAKAVRSVYQATATQIAGLLEDHGLGCVEVLQAMVAAVPGLDAGTAASALEDAGFPAAEVLAALTQVLAVSAEIAAAAVVAAGYAPATAVQVAAAVIGSAALLAQIVYENIGSGQLFLLQATQALKDHAQLSREVAAQAMAEAARWVQQVIDAVLDQVFGPAPPPPVGSPAQWSLWGNAAAAAARQVAGEWIAGASIPKGRCRVDGPAATAGPGAVTSSATLSGRVEKALRKAGAPGSVAKAWDAAFVASWTTWAKGVTLPGLPWYPSFSAYPGAEAPPTPNVPSPLGTLVSRGVGAMSPRGLSSAVSGKIGDAASEPGAAAAIQSFAADLGGRFSTCMASCNVMTVLGSGPVPGYKPPFVSTAPVVDGACWGGMIPQHPF